MPRINKQQPAKVTPNDSRAAHPDAIRELGEQLVEVLPHSQFDILERDPARLRWHELNKTGLLTPRAMWDKASMQFSAFLFDDGEPEPVAGLALRPLQEPHANDVRFIQAFCRVFNQDLRTAPNVLAHAEMWDTLTATRFARSIGRFSPFSTLPFMRWLRTIESASHLRYEGAQFRANILMTKQLKWVVDSVRTFVPFPKPIDFEAVFLHEKWARSLAGEPEVALVGLGHRGSVVGAIAIPKRRPKSIFPPHKTISGVVSLVRPGTMAFISAPNSDIYVVLPNDGMFVRAQGRWQYLNYSSFRDVLRRYIFKTVVDSAFRLVLDLSFQRRGALLCFLEDSAMVSRAVPDHSQQNRPNDALRRSGTYLDIKKAEHRQILLATASVDGAMVFSKGGKVLDSACMIGEPDSAVLSKCEYTQLQRFPGARSTAAWNASMYGLAIKVSEDGPVSVYKSGKLVGQMA